MCIIIIIYIIIYIYVCIANRVFLWCIFLYATKWHFFHGDSDGKPSQHDQIDRFTTFHQNLWMLVCTLW